MKKLLFIILAGVFFSCKNTQPQEKEVKQEIKKISKLETLYSLPKDSIYDFYDLSNDSIKEFPDLSEYSIKKLDLSHNQIDSIIVKNLPKQLEDLNVSYNNFSNQLSLNIKTPLNSINLSHNKIRDCYMEVILKRLILSNNDFEYMTLCFDRLEYLDISNNTNLGNIVGFHPKYVDTIVRENIKNNKKLIFVLDSWSKVID